MPSRPSDRFATVCEIHGKRSYPSRRLAKAAARDMRTPGLREYPCAVTPGYWHFGHLPQATVVGIKTAAEVYHPNAREERQ